MTGIERRSACQRRLAAACIAAVLGLTGVGRCPAGEDAKTPRFDPGAVRQALARRWEKVKQLPGSLRRDGVEKASYSVVGNDPGKTKIVAAEEAPPARKQPVSKTVFWWAVPRTARTASKSLAASRQSSVTRIVRVREPDGTAHFDVYAARRVGLKRLPESVIYTAADDQAKTNTPP